MPPVVLEFLKTGDKTLSAEAHDITSKFICNSLGNSWFKKRKPEQKAAWAAWCATEAAKTCRPWSSLWVGADNVFNAVKLSAPRKKHEICKATWEEMNTLLQTRLDSN
jgi:hypothetical protein